MMPTAPTQELVHSLSASASRKNIIYLLRIDYPATFDRIPSLAPLVNSLQLRHNSRS